MGIPDTVNSSFRPLDGESFSKHREAHHRAFGDSCFRPLDGESFSKRVIPRCTILIDPVSVP